MNNMLHLLVVGFIIGFSIAAPIGPIGTLCIQRSLRSGFLIGLSCGLGAAVVDGLYASIAGFGLTAIQDFLLQYKTILGFFGGAFLCYLGWQTYQAPVIQINRTDQTENMGYAFLSTAVLTAMSPSTILPFVAVLTNFDNPIVTIGDSYSFVGGVFSGAACWFLILTTLVSFFRTKIDALLIAIINKVSGFIILAFGFYSIFSVLYSFFVKDTL